MNILLALLSFLFSINITFKEADMRNVNTGMEIPSVNYADQPYVVITPKGEWVCILTTGSGREGSKGQHVASSISADKGKTWSPLVDIEPPEGPEASWACPLITKFGRIYAFYTYNGDNIHLGRDDTHGWYAYKDSDDSGHSWAEKRYRLPMRVTACDKLYKDGQLVQMFWGICKPIVVDDTVYFSYTKLGEYFLGNGEGWVFKSDNILTEKDPEKIRWEMLPEGEYGIRNPDFGSIQEEHNLAALSNGDLVCIYRTTNGWPAISYSRDKGKTWDLPKKMAYTPGGRVMRNPRACPKIWRCDNGKFLFWFHNNGCKDFNNRNPVWISGGIEKDGFIHWSQPEILLYNDDPQKRMSYPDLIQQDGRYWVTETEKEKARIHEIDVKLLEAMWNQVEGKGESVRNEAMFSINGKEIFETLDVDIPELPDLSKDGGFTIEMQIILDNPKTGSKVLEAGDENSGMSISVTDNKSLAIQFHDNNLSAYWDIDNGMLETDKLHHVAFIVDGGPKIITCVVDDKLCDGNTHERQFGWGRFNPDIRFVSNGKMKLFSNPGIEIRDLRIYDRFLLTSEAIANR
ncbi:hypothetical protein GF312_17845 [Candidatus Poribacteria bacterium]|nr:hypothetical protein [Candidatus Poribacteria bacterium]